MNGEGMGGVGVGGVGVGGVDGVGVNGVDGVGVGGMDGVGVGGMGAPGAALSKLVPAAVPTAVPAAVLWAGSGATATGGRCGGCAQGDSAWGCALLGAGETVRSDGTGPVTAGRSRVNGPSRSTGGGAGCPIRCGGTASAGLAPGACADGAHCWPAAGLGTPAVGLGTPAVGSDAPTAGAIVSGGQSGSMSRSGTGGCCPGPWTRSAFSSTTVPPQSSCPRIGPARDGPGPEAGRWGQPV